MNSCLSPVTTKWSEVANDYRLDEGTSVWLECNADHLMKIQMKIIGSVIVAQNKIG